MPNNNMNKICTVQDRQFICIMSSLINHLNMSHELYRYEHRVILLYEYESYIQITILPIAIQSTTKRTYRSIFFAGIRSYTYTPV